MTQQTEALADIFATDPEWLAKIDDGRIVLHFTVEQFLAIRAALSSQPPAPSLPEGWKLVAVNAGFDDLMYWLDRCNDKGHLENCSDLIEPWAAFDWRASLTATAGSTP